MRTSPTRVREPDRPKSASALPENTDEQAWHVLELRIAFKLRPGAELSPDAQREIRTIGAALGEVAAEQISTALPAGSAEHTGAGTIRFGKASAELTAVFDRALAAGLEPAFDTAREPSDTEH